ncbi:hypothetical protein [Burkholderia sp. IMCC1007]|uniref:hypothetical protein n=1 Tax=Burkholderia sp. IMCC1007 TaxID=3004104 RepID=UPI0022B337A6|nr:hypothetical protein [Burkholderia sp. IMCC1007]
MGFIELSSLKYVRTYAHDPFPQGWADSSRAISTTPPASLRSQCRAGVGTHDVAVVELRRDAEWEGAAAHDDATRKRTPLLFRSFGKTAKSLTFGSRFAIDGVKIFRTRSADVDRYSVQDA